MFISNFAKFINEVQNTQQKMTKFRKQVKDVASDEIPEFLLANVAK
jgi:hypothetical protein